MTSYAESLDRELGRGGFCVALVQDVEAGLGEGGGPLSALAVGLAGLVQVDQARGGQGFECGQVEAGGSAIGGQVLFLEAAELAEGVPLAFGQRRRLGGVVGQWPILRPARDGGPGASFVQECRGRAGEQHGIACSEAATVARGRAADALSRRDGP